MRVLLLGNGGREHAIGWKLAQSRGLTTLISAPGNPGLADLGAVVPGFDATDPTAVVDLAVANAVDLVVVGPEAPLAAGVVDALQENGVTAFGPVARAARLESSKAFAKDVMVRAGVPTGTAETFTDLDAAADHLRAIDPPYVVKADGLAAGKGVLVTEDLDAATAWARLCLTGGFGDAGRTVVVEEHLDGREVSVFAICDGTTAVPLVPARDYKRLGEGGTGPNTGGMGCFSPVEDLPEGLVDTTMGDVIAPVLETMAADGLPYRGFLYAGLMLSDDGPKVLEFNCRLGDPETQVVLPRLEEDLLTLLADAASGSLRPAELRWSAAAAVDVVLASKGYPTRPRTGFPIDGLDHVSNALVFHAGTTRTADGIVTSGGRVLNVVGCGPDVPTARSAAYAAADQIRFEGKTYRKDIGE
jgi:phosphoribosylamine--glycine ligase